MIMMLSLEPNTLTNKAQIHLSFTQHLQKKSHNDQKGWIWLGLEAISLLTWRTPH